VALGFIVKRRTNGGSTQDGGTGLLGQRQHWHEVGNDARLGRMGDGWAVLEQLGWVEWDETRSGTGLCLRGK
jgi:hypothetical protein